METQDDTDVVTPERFLQLVNVVATQIQDDGYNPDMILALASGGFVPAAALAKRLPTVTTLEGISVKKDGQGNYHPETGLVRLSLFAGRRVLVVDEASDRGILTQQVVKLVSSHGGLALSCVLIARESGIQPDFVGGACRRKPPRFFWE